MSISKHKKGISSIRLLFLIIMWLITEVAFTQSSAHYKLKKSVLDQGGGTSQSTHHSVFDAVGQPSPPGEMSSTHYSAVSGFVPVSAGISSISLNLDKGWNMFSINVMPADLNIATLMNPILDQIVIVKNGSGQTWIPAYGINTIGEINIEESYQVYLKDGTSLVVTGSALVLPHPIILPRGWSMIGYLPTVPIDAEIALTSIADQLVIAKNSEGQSYIPAYGINQIGQMKPGQGYQVYLNAGGTLNYPSGGALNLVSAPNLVSTSEVGAKFISPKHYQFVANTGENATVVLPINIDPNYSDGTLLEASDEIGVFNSSGICCGADVWQGDNVAITIWGDDSQTDSLDGFQSGEILNFRIWRKNANLEYPVRISFQQNHQNTYQINSFSVLTEFVADLSLDISKKDASAIPTDFKLLQNYPNPFNPETIIEYHLPKAADVILAIYDLQGHEVRRFITGNKPAGCHTALWDGRDETGASVASGLYFYRVRAKDFSATKKCLLMR